jgi:alcohol dehydrogenase (cytochrome c)
MRCDRVNRVSYGGRMRVTGGRRISLRIVLALAAFLGCIMVAASEDRPQESRSVIVDVPPAELIASPPGANWPSYNGDFTGRRFSSLSQINLANVGQLRAQWVFHSNNSNRMEMTPVVVNGVMFVTSANDTYALDARTGLAIWHHALPVSEGLIDDASGHLSRGVALWHSRVYRLTDNAHLLCLDARSGHLLWDVAYANWNKNYGATGAPLVVNDKVIVGTSGGDDGVRGFVAAYDATTGKLAWRFWTIPAPGEAGSESWPGDLYQHGGGTTWMPGTYDPETSTLYWTTSNPSPDFDGEVRPGDDLYTDCVLALDANTGKLKWYFQFTPHDLFDFDATETPMLIDTVYQGQPRKLLVQANRNGFLYVLDRTNGKFLSATPFVSKLSWAKGIDTQGRPIRSGLGPTPEGTRLCPGFAGSTNWFAPSYNESTRIVYFLVLEECQVFSAKPQKFEEGKTFYSTGVKRIPGEVSQKTLVAYDLDKQAIAWSYPQAGHARSSAGTMTTASGLVFFGDDAQSFEAVDARTGKALWYFNTGQDLGASPMSYAVLDKQYVAIAAGSDVFSFALP